MIRDQIIQELNKVFICAENIRIKKVTLDAIRIKSYDSIETAIKQGVSQLTSAIEFMKR